MSQQQQQEQGKEPRMGPVDIVLYGAILCIHYPLKLTVVTYKTSKAAVVTTISLPRRALNFAFSTASAVKQEIGKTLRGTIAVARNTTSESINAVNDTKRTTTNLVRNTTTAATNLVRNTTSAATNLVRNTTSAATNVVRNTTSAATNLVRNTASAATTLAQNTTSAAINVAEDNATSAISVTRNYAYYALGLLNQAKAEANHQFETKINEPKLQYEKALTETANSLSDYTVTTANAVKETAEGKVKKAYNFVRNVTYIGWDVLKQLTEDPNAPTDPKTPEPKNQYEKTFARFQAAAFETERQSLKAEIMKLHEELKRGQQNNPGFDKERYKCDKQIHDLQEQLTRIHLTYTQQKQQILSEYDKERHQYQQEIQKANHQLVKAQVSYEQLSKQQVTGFDKERHQYQEEIQRLLHKVATLREELVKHEDTNHNDNIHDEDDANVQNPYVTEAFQKIDIIRKDMHDLKRKIGEFSGTERDDAYLQINEHIIRNLIKLDNIESKGYNIVRKRRKEALRFVQKCQDELKSKV